MLPVGAILVDFDGTACSADVSEVLLERFGDPSWPELDAAVDRGELGLRAAAHRQAAMLTGSRDEMLAYAVETCPMDPTFAPFVDWVESVGLPITVVSDGFAFYIPAILEAAGLERLPFVTNELVFDRGDPELRHPNGHPVCVGCGTCKMLVAVGARAEHGSIAYVGEGQSDRYGALYSDVVFAKLGLVEIAERDGVSYRTWETFEDVRDALEAMTHTPGPIAPEVCPGWTVPA